MIKPTSTRVSHDLKSDVKTKNNSKILKKNIKVEIKLKDSNQFINRVNTPIAKTPLTPHGNKKIELSNSNKLEKSKKHTFIRKNLISDTDYNNKLCSTAPNKNESARLYKNNTNKNLERHISYGRIEVIFNHERKILTH